MSHSYHMKCEHCPFIPIYCVCNESWCLSISSTACMLLVYAIAAAPLFVVAACGMDQGLKGRVTFRITLAYAFSFSFDGQAI